MKIKDIERFNVVVGANFVMSKVIIKDRQLQLKLLAVQNAVSNAKNAPCWVKACLCNIPNNSEMARTAKEITSDYAIVKSQVFLRVEGEAKLNSKFASENKIPKKLFFSLGRGAIDNGLYTAEEIKVIKEISDAVDEFICHCNPVQRAISAQSLLLLVLTIPCWFYNCSVKAEVMNKIHENEGIVLHDDCCGVYIVQIMVNAKFTDKYQAAQPKPQAMSR